MEKVEEKVNRLEAAFEEFTRTVGLEFNKVYNAIMLSHINYDRISQDIAQLGNRIEATRELLDNFIKESEKQRQEDRQKFNEFKDEMKDFKDEMKDFKDEMKDFKDEMKDFKDEMKDFKDEMKDFKDEMKDFKDDSIDFKAEMKSFKDEMREEHRKMNQQWGELANKMGTIVEDIIYPATRPVLEKYFNCELETTMMNITRKKDGIKDEFDVIAVSADKVFLIEVKSTMRQQYVDDFKNKKLERFRFLFSEYNDKTLVPILATLRYEDSMLAYVTKNNIYAMAYREWDYMDILNFDNVVI
jgi:chromosome segregation ATPase